MSLSFQPSEQSYAGDYGAPVPPAKAKRIRTQIAAREKALARQKPGSPAAARLRGAIAALRAQLPAPRRAAAPPRPAASLARSRPAQVVASTMSRSRVASGSSSFVPSGITGSIAAAVDQGQPVADEQVAQSQLAIDIPDTSTVQAVALDDDDGADLSVDADLDLSVDLDGDGPPLYKRPIVWIGIVGIAGLCWWKRDLLKLKYLSMKGA